MKTFFFLVFTSWCFVLNAQSVESSFAGQKDCIETDLLALDLIPQFYEQNQPDSIELILDYVALKCTESASLRLTRFLLLIEQHRFDASIITPLDLHYIKKEASALAEGHLYDFEQMADAMKLLNYTQSGSVFFRRGVIEAKYVNMLRAWTQKLSERTDNTALEKAVLYHLSPYSQRTGGGLWWLASGMKSDQRFTKTYNDYHHNFVIFRSWQLTLTGGRFIPTAGLQRILGSRFMAGFSIGKNIGNGKQRIDLSGNFIFGKTRQPFFITRPDTSFTSDRGYTSFGHLDYVRTIWRPNRFLEWNVLGGLGFAEKGIYRKLDEDPDEDDEPEDVIHDKMGKAHIIKPSFSLGSEFKLFIGSGVALNMQARYMFFNFGNIAGSDFRGTAFFGGAGLTFHWGGHPLRGTVSISSFR